MGSSRVEQALNELDPGSRAVVDLSLGTDFSDENIATLIRVEAGEVQRRRERAIDSIQSAVGDSRERIIEELCTLMGVAVPEQLGAGRPDLANGASPNGSEPALASGSSNGSAPESDHATATAVDEHQALDADAELDAGPEPEREATPEPAPDEPELNDDPELNDELEQDDVHKRDDAPEPEPIVDSEPAVVTHPDLEPGTAEPAPAPFPLPEPDPERRSVRAGGVLGGVALAVVLVGAVVVIGSSGSGGDEPVPEPSPPTSAPDPQANPGGEQAESFGLAALADAPARGSIEARLSGSELVLRLDGLPRPDGAYEAWLFTSLLDSESLGSTDGGSGVIRAELPENAAEFRYLDVSIQPAEGELHSGRSIYRVPVRRLTGAG